MNFYSNIWLPVSINHELIECEARCALCGELYEKHSAAGDFCPDDRLSGRKFELYVGVKE